MNKQDNNILIESETCSTHGEYECHYFMLGRTKMPSAGNECPQCAAITLAEFNKKQQQLALEQDEQRRQWKIEAFESCIPPRFKNARLESFLVDNKKQQSALNICKKYIDSFDTKIKDSGGGLIFTGNVGTGKTHLAIGIGREIAKKGHSVEYIGLIQLVREIRSAWSDDTKNESQIIKHYQTKGLLILDEIGAQNGTENERNILFEIIDGRYQRVLPTIILSNLSKDEVAQLISQRSVDRITQGGAVIPFDWESKRGTL